MGSYWVLFNAVLETPHQAAKDLISEAAVEEEVEAVCAHLKALGHPCVRYPLVDIRKLVHDLATPPLLIFNLCEGFRGNAKKEMHVAALLELLGIPFTGNSAKTLGIAQDKDLTKRILSSAGIPTPKWMVYRGGTVADHIPLSFPLIVKPAQEDASLGIEKRNVVRDTESLNQVAGELYRRYLEPILIEEYLSGREFSVSLLEVEGELRTLPISEISLEGLGKEGSPLVSYEAKWIEDSPEYKLTPSICPAPVHEELGKALRTLAIKTWEILGGKDYGRVDIRLDGEGKPFVLEFNPNPDISLQAGFSKSLKAAGIPYERFLEILIHNNLQSKEVSP